MNDDRLRQLLSKLLTVVPHADYIESIRNGAPVICMRVADVVVTPMPPDNKVGHCGVCGEMITFRPYNEVATNKICVHCAAAMNRAAEA